ncbi:hypothetical protein PTO0241 [Picrophilus oshimae DSM 9789]|uniref:Uncharacterized protein n=1 Tax=Picrophilus torridus (strain ATCC 700027 / DSM 9790 / JCM 10055 / NBRC 100828 / KAW 2/3) TaxID=1122961 RepID=Q6L2H6_PICTO|nr:hypothetical protein PTO0241 [Picrophilus oshimae DSM 9789]
MRAGVIGVQESMSEIGYVISSSGDDLSFVLNPGENVRRWDYVSVFNNGEIIGRIISIESRSQLVDLNTDYKSMKRYIENNINDSTNICHVQILGHVVNDNVRNSREIINIGTPVYLSNSDTLSRIFSFNDEESLKIGKLMDSNIDVSININGLRRHVAILAQTGAGKSHTAGVIIEELIKKGASVIVLDPHADYVFMKKTHDDKIYNENVMVFRTPMSTGRYGSEVGIVNTFTIRFQDLNQEDLCGIMDINESWANLTGIVNDIFDNMKGQHDYDDFMETAKSLGENYNKIRNRLRYLEKIKGVFSNKSTGINDYLSPGRLSILDLSGLDEYLADYFAWRILNTVYDAKFSNDFKYPVFVVVEEAHRFVPPRERGRTKTGEIIKKIAAEGRKFGIFLIVITQRPGKIDQDVLSQCNSQIILRITNPADQNAVINSSESITEYIIEDLPSLDIGEAVLTGEFVKMPCIVKIRNRETRAGGSDIDIISLLRMARDEIDSMNDPRKIKERNKKLLGDL